MLKECGDYMKDLEKENKKLDLETGWEEKCLNERRKWSSKTKEKEWQVKGKIKKEATQTEEEEKTQGESSKIK